MSFLQQTRNMKTILILLFISVLMKMIGEVYVQVLENILRNPVNNVYHLYTRRNPRNSQILIINDAESINSSYFNPNVPTVVISHGWLGSKKSILNPIIRDVYLEKSDVNFIVLEGKNLRYIDYITAIACVPAVGKGLGQFLNFLNLVTGAPFDKMHLIGFSLGAHVVGNAGRELGGRVARVTGLDPAGILMNWSDWKDWRLSKTDAVYVEAIHTDGSMIGLGMGYAVAKADFFPNGGKLQPGCYIPLTGCSHDRAWEFFAATITYNHLVGQECANSHQVIANTCRGNYLHMGNDILNKTGSGLYRVNTGANYPFFEI